MWQRLIDFLNKTSNYVGVELTNYLLKITNYSPMFRINALRFEMNWTPLYLKDLYIYYLLGNIPLMILLIYIFQQLKTVFKPFEDMNEPFTIKSMIAFKRIGFSIVIWYVIKMGYDLIVPMNIMINHNKEITDTSLIGDASLFLNITEIFLIAIIASIFIGLSQIFKRGLEIKDDNDSII